MSDPIEVIAGSLISIIATIEPASGDPDLSDATVYAGIKDAADKTIIPLTLQSPTTPGNDLVNGLIIIQFEPAASAQIAKGTYILVIETIIDGNPEFYLAPVRIRTAMPPAAAPAISSALAAAGIVGQAFSYQIAAGSTGASSVGSTGAAGSTGALGSTGAAGALSNPLGQIYEVVYDDGTHGTGTVTLNFSQGNVHELTVSGPITIAFTGAVNTRECCMKLYLTNGGTNITWPASAPKLDWPGGSAPPLSTSGLDILAFSTIDGAATAIYGVQSGKGFA